MQSKSSITAKILAVSIVAFGLTSGSQAQGFFKKPTAAPPVAAPAASAPVTPAPVPVATPAPAPTPAPVAAPQASPASTPAAKKDADPQPAQAKPVVKTVKALMATSNSPTCGQANSPRQRGWNVRL